MPRLQYFLLFILFSSFGFSERLYFLHIPKTGGTTLRLLLELQLSNEEIYPFRFWKHPVTPVNERLVSGHFPYWFCKQLDPQFDSTFKVTILRDPVERYFSFLRAKKKADPTLPDLESVIRLRQQPRQKYREGLIDNALCRYLSADPHLTGEALLNSAKKTLDEMDYIVFFDRFEQDLIELFQRLGMHLDKEYIPKINTTEKESISEQLFNEVKQLNELDIQLYQYAKTHYEPKNTQFPLRTASFENLLKKTSLIDYTFNLPLWGKGWTYRDTLPVAGSSNKAEEYPVYRWVTSQPAEIYFDLEKKDYSLLFNANSLSHEIVPRVSVNGKEIEIVAINTDVFSLYQGVIPKDWITEEPTKISFYSSKTVQYRNLYPQHHNRNYPPLCFCLNRIQIIPILPQ